MNQKLRLFDKKAGHYIIPWKGDQYDDLDLTYANCGTWYYLGGDELPLDSHVMEWTIGVVDSKGNDIYDGDIYKDITDGYKPTHMKISYDPGSACWMIGKDMLRNFMHEGKLIKEIVRVGNVCENPDLLN
jgi:hypothetical protein